MSFYRNKSGQPIAVNMLRTDAVSPLIDGITTVYVADGTGVQINIGTATHMGNGSWVIEPSSIYWYEYPNFTFVNDSGVNQTINAPTIKQYVHPTSVPTVGDLMEDFLYFMPIAVSRKLDLNKTSGIRTIYDENGVSGVFQTTESDDGTTYTSGPLVPAT